MLPTTDARAELADATVVGGGIDFVIFPCSGRTIRRVSTERCQATARFHQAVAADTLSLICTDHSSEAFSRRALQRALAALAG